MLPSEHAAVMAAVQAELLSHYPPHVTAQVNILTKKMYVLGFTAAFTRMVEGPIVRTFYFKPAGEPKFSCILNQAEELAGSLAVESVRIERQLGELSISVPREDRQTIHFDDCLHNMMTSPTTANMALPLLMGQSTTGEHLYADLSNQPHLLIAGATNSGKSVYTAQLICSLALFRSSKELEFILVDTKNLDLILFRELDHVKYVLNNVEDLRANLEELLADVRLRNAEMSGMARNIKEWNALQVRESDKMKHKVLIIDELADVFDQDVGILRGMPAKLRPPSIHSLLKQIAQISRAAGVHLILATQRPSVKILSGDVKANFPARVCFKLPSSFDSRVVIDENGAENLLGMGDYLYKIAGSDTVKRAHSAFVSMTNIATIITQCDEIRRQYGAISSRG